VPTRGWGKPIQITGGLAVLKGAVPPLVIRVYTLEGFVGDQTIERPSTARQGNLDIGNIEGIELAISWLRSSNTVRL
jgi:hypothetical protein